MNLFSERDVYETRVEESKEDRRRCYIVVMLCMDETVYHFTDNVESIYVLDFDGIFGCSENNFFEEHFDNLLKIFPNAKNVLDRNKFLEE